MITGNTVFILGAGASCPYGFPTGIQLRQQICSLFIKDSEDYFTQYETSAGKLRALLSKAKEFTDKFHKSSIGSIDLFLARNPEFMMMGKWAILFRIFDAENKSGFRESTPRQDQDWYTYLYRKLTDGLLGKDDYCRFQENDVSFITFNYDRSLEHFLYESLLNSFNGISAVKIQAQLKQKKIIHVFGQVGSLEWQELESKIRYGTDVKYIDPKRIADNLTIIYEEKENPELEEAHKLISAAQRIFFLGFGFAKENLEILKIPEILNVQQQICGTALDSKKKEIEDIRNIFPGEDVFIGTQYEKKNIKIHNMDCLGLLREYL